jgi:predicted ATPase
VGDPALVIPTIARTLGVREAAGENPCETLAAALRPPELLLLVDNAEHLREATPQLVELLAQAPRLTLLVTSRVVLHLSGEHVYPVQPLSGGAASSLFRARARAANHRFQSSHADDDAIAQVCARLDGLPLAIELAASRTRTLTPAELLDRLEPRLPLLAGGPHDAPARQQTLHATLQWSFDLLAREEQQGLAQLSVFAGGCTLEAAETVAGATLERLTTLVDHNLLQHGRSPHGSRYTMLETIREYAGERLAEQEDPDRPRRALAHYLLALVEGDSGAVADAEPERALPDRLGYELDNLRAAVAWALVAGETELALRLAIEARWFAPEGLPGEQRMWLAKALQAGGEVAAKTRARAFLIAGSLAYRLNDHGHAIDLLTASLRDSRAIGDAVGCVRTLHMLGVTELTRGNHARARRYFDSSLALARENSDAFGRCQALHDLGELERALGNLREASRLLDESAGLARATGNDRELPQIIHGAADVALAERNLPRAAHLYQEALRLASEQRRTNAIAACLGGLAAVAAAEGDQHRAARLWSGLATLEHETNEPLPSGLRKQYEQELETCFTDAPEALEAALADAQQLTAAEAVQDALAADKRAS